MKVEALIIVKRLLTLTILPQALLALVSGALLSLSFLDAQYYFFAWFAFVPLLSAIKGANLTRTYCMGLLSGLAFCVSAGYWVVDFLMLSKDYDLGTSILWALFFWFYCAQLTALLSLCFNWLKRRSQVHEFILFPLLIVFFYSAYPMIFTVHLGESQSHFLIALQAIEFVGVHGLDMLIALVNIVLFRCIFRRAHKPNIKTSLLIKWPWLLALLIIAGWFTYGFFMTSSWDKTQAAWQTVRVGIVQPNEIPQLEKMQPYPGYSLAYPPEIAMTQRLASAGAELVIWPEAKYKGYFDFPHVRNTFQENISKFNTRLIFQDIQSTPPATKNDKARQYNSAVMLKADGQLHGQYQKMKRIAFGEYVPFVSDVPLIRSWVEGFFGRFLNEINQGKKHQVFEDGRLRVIPLICYETMFPEFVASAVGAAMSRSRSGGMLIGLSSDGWFGRTHQPYQHANASILRAVENRLPLVHVLNNGPSIVVVPNGRVILKTQDHQAGGHIVDVPYSNISNGSFYSRHPYWFIYSVYGILAMIVFTFPFIHNRKTG